MAAKRIIYHAVHDVHVTKRRKNPRYKNSSPFVWDRDYSICGYPLGQTEHRDWFGAVARKGKFVNAAKCPRRVNCKLCLRNRKFRRANPAVK